MIVSAKYIFRPRVVRICAVCEQKIDGMQIRLYGAAHRGDPLYVVYTHPSCTPIESLKKLNKSVVMLATQDMKGE